MPTRVESDQCDHNTIVLEFSPGRDAGAGSCHEKLIKVLKNQKRVLDWSILENMWGFEMTSLQGTECQRLLAFCRIRSCVFKRRETLHRTVVI